MVAPQVLVVEDHPTEQRVLTLLLNKFGYEATIAPTGTAAVELVLDRGRRFSVILMDCTMEDMDGFECTRQIRDVLRQHREYVPIIACTAHAMLGDKQKCLNAGMDDYLSKPFTAAQLENLLQHWLSAQKTLTG